MYYQHFGLSGPPFQFTPSPKVLYMSKAHREAMAALEWGLLHEPSGFTVLVGETGTGKTTLICSLLMGQYDLVRTAYVANPKLGFEEMARVMMRQLGIHARQGRLNTVDAFNRFLSQLQVGERVVVIVDEAQGLSDEALEELRLFSNAGQREEKQLHFVLVGQPELMKRVAQHALRQFNERIGARAILNPLTREEAFAYVEYRLAAHEGSARQIFGRGALEYLIDHSGGIPRRINVLCHNAMLLAYSAGANQIDLGAARAAVAEFENLFASARRFNPSAPTWMKPLRVAGAALAVAAVAIFVAGAAWLWFASSHREDPLLNLTKSASAAQSAGTRAPHSNAAKDSPIPSGPSTAEGNALAGNSAMHRQAKMSLDGTADSANGTSTAELDPKYVQAADPHPADLDNGAGAAPAATKADASNPAATRQVRVKHGDTLMLIAIRYLGSEGQLGNLINANPQLSNIDLIYPGEIIHLPATGAPTPQE